MDTNIYKNIDGSSFRFAIIRARFNTKITKGLLESCVGVLITAGVAESNIDVVEVPGSVEIPYALSELAQLDDYDAIITLAAVIKGSTPHFDYISQSVTNGIREISIKHRIPVIAGVITCLNLKQAKERSGGGSLDRGVEAAQVALEMAELRKQRGWKAN